MKAGLVAGNQCLFLGAGPTLDLGFPPTGGDKCRMGFGINELEGPVKSGMARGISLLVFLESLEEIMACSHIETT